MDCSRDSYSYPFLFFILFLFSLKMKLTCCRLQSQELALQNFGFVNPKTYDSLARVVKGKDVYAEFSNLVVIIKGDKNVGIDEIALNSCQREYTRIQLRESVNLKLLDSESKTDIMHFIPIDSIEFQLSLFVKSDRIIEIKDEELEEVFKANYMNHVFTQGQIMAITYKDILMKCVVTKVMVAHFDELKKWKGTTSMNHVNHQTKNNKESKGELGYRGILFQNTDIIFMSNDESKLQIESKKVFKKSIIKGNFNFEELGIGALDDEFKTIFRRTFASRIYPNYIIKQLGIKHVKGLILYGPPGTGKTLIARQIGKTLNAREPKIINGPEILNKYVGQSEENVRNLFRDAEIEYKQNGENSLLHIIILDEIDAICRQRGGGSSASGGVTDSVVNQLLSKIDGVDSLNNILLIGMTNRIDLIDEALLRPGRFELHIEISLPNKEGRIQILNIHTSSMRKSNKLSSDVDLLELAEKTPNYSGAEIEGLVRNAVSYAFERHINFDDLTKPMNADEIQITKEDFMEALKETKPAFGVQDDLIDNYLSRGIINYGPAYEKVENTCKLLIQQIVENENTNVMSILLHGEHGSGKTTIAAFLAKEAHFYFTKFITPDNLIGYSEAGKINYIHKVFEDAYKTPLSLVVLDNIERLIDYTRIGPRFSNSLLQTIMVLIKKKPKKKDQKILIIGTTSEYVFMRDAGLTKCFYVRLEIPLLNLKTEIRTVLKDRNETHKDFPLEEIEKVLANESIRNIAINNLLMIIDMASQMAGGRNITSELFLKSLNDCGLFSQEED